MSISLLDKFGRKHNYLRLSLTDKCNLRCIYCMPEEVDFMKNDKLMSTDEIKQLTSVFVNEFGVNKIRLTGGEPLVRRDFDAILNHLSTLNVELCLTSNALLIEDKLELLKLAQVSSVNISIDTLKEDKFLKITRRNGLNTVLRSIDKLIESEIKVKLNVVAIKGFNDDEVVDFIKLTRDNNISVRFIEFMPFSGNKWDMAKVFSFTEILAEIQKKYSFSKVEDGFNSTSKAYKVDGFKGKFSIITTVSNPFCNSCNRIRLTADGKIRNCLFDTSEIDLLTALRNNENVVSLIQQSFNNKKEKLGGLDFTDKVLQKEISKRSMVKIGG